jgi:hypothetical protein
MHEEQLKEVLAAHAAVAETVKQAQDLRAKNRRTLEASRKLLAEVNRQRSELQNCNV